MQANLSELRSWKLDNDKDDIRGWALRDGKGRPLGRVAELVVDTDQKHVTEVVLGDGRRLPAHDIAVGDHVLVMQPSEPIREESTPPRRETEVTRQESDTARAAPPVEARAPVSDAPQRREMTGTEADLDDVVVSLIEEDVEFGKRAYEKGVTRVQSRVVERPFEHALRLRDEAIHVERKKVDAPLGPGEADARLVDQRVEVLAITEHPITEKHARVVEELVVRKKAEERSERLTETIRRTSVEITELPGTVQELTAGAKP